MTESVDAGAAEETASTVVAPSVGSVLPSTGDDAESLSPSMAPSPPTEEESVTDIPSWISAAVAVGGAIGSLIGWFKSRRSQAKTERTAEESTKALKNLVKQGKAAAGRAEQALATAREHADSASRSASAVESIASAFSPPRLTVEWQTHEHFALRNTSSSPITIEAFSDPEAFLRDPFTTPVELAPGQSVTGDVTEAAGYPAPGELLLLTLGRTASSTGFIEALPFIVVGHGFSYCMWSASTL